MSTIFKGSGVALVTPFTNGEVDYTALTRLIELQIISGTDAIIVCGTTGEAATLSQEERVEVIRFAVDRVNRRLPVIAGTGGNNTAAVIDFSRTAEALGVDGLLIVTPFYNKTTQKGLVAHYGAICEQVHIPIIVYNVPSRTGLNVLPATMREIMDVCENVVGIKEASGNIEQIVNLAALCPGLDIYSGNDDHILPVLSDGLLRREAGHCPQTSIQPFTHLACRLFGDQSHPHQNHDGHDGSVLLRAAAAARAPFRGERSQDAEGVEGLWPDFIKGTA